MSAISVLRPRPVTVVVTVVVVVVVVVVFVVVVVVAAASDEEDGREERKDAVLTFLSRGLLIMLATLLLPCLVGEEKRD